MNKHPPHKKSPQLLTVTDRDPENEKFNQELCSLHAMTTISKIGILLMEKDTMLSASMSEKCVWERKSEGEKLKGKESRSEEGSKSKCSNTHHQKLYLVLIQQRYLIQKRHTSVHLFPSW